MVVYVIVALVLVVLAALALSVRILKQYERAVVFRLGRVRGGPRGPGLIVFAPFVDRVHRVSLRIVTMPIQSWGMQVTVVELRDIQLPDSMQRAMARQAEAEREKRAKIIAAEGESLAAGELAHASDVMQAHPLALQLRNLQTLVEISVDKNSTVIFPAPLMSTIQELGGFLSRETTALDALPNTPAVQAARDDEPRAA